MSSRTRVPTYDGLRVSAIFGVIGIHVSATLMALAGDYSGWLWNLDRLLLRFSVPIFFFVSGALVWAGWQRQGWSGWVSFLGRRSRRILLPYLGWSVAYWTLSPLLGVERTVFGSRQWFGMFLTGGAMYHLYFIPILMVFYFVTPVAKWLLDRSPFLLLAVAMILNFGTANWLAGNIPYLPHEIETVLTWASFHIPYIALGAVYATSAGLRKVSSSWWPAFLLVGLHGMYGPLPVTGGGLVRNWVALTAALGIVGLSGLSSRIGGESFLGRFVAAVAPETYVVYLAHPLILLLIREAVGGRNVDWFSPVVFAVVYSVVTVAAFGGAVAWHRARARVDAR